MKQHNEYELLISSRIPKSILAAVLVSEYLNRVGVEPENLNAVILAEWEILHANGIVPQRAISLTPVTGDGAGAPAGDDESSTRTAGEHDG